MDAAALLPGQFVNLAIEQDERPLVGADDFHPPFQCRKDMRAARFAVDQVGGRRLDEHPGAGPVDRLLAGHAGQAERGERFHRLSLGEMRKKLCRGESLFTPHGRAADVHRGGKHQTQAVSTFDLAATLRDQFHQRPADVPKATQYDLYRLAHRFPFNTSSLYSLGSMKASTMTGPPAAKASPSAAR